jgi:diketogulonate reductase-like aldo/keto reductase
VAEAEQSLRRLGVDQVDLYIIHWPQNGPTWAWPGMERARETGYARSIGVSNFSVEELAAVEAIASSPPVVDQVQFSPFEYRRRLLAACEEREITVEAYSPLGTGRHLQNPVVARVAEGVGRTPAQVLLRWCLQRGTVVIPKSTHRERIEENAQIFDFVLSDDDLATLDDLDRTGGTDAAREQKWW